MKRILACLLLLSLAFYVFPTLSEDAVAAGVDEDPILDLSKYSDDEILKIYGLVQAELEARHLLTKKAEVPSGEYIVGKDIPAGRYIYKPNSNAHWCAYIVVYEDSTKENCLIDERVELEDSYTLDLVEGNVFLSDMDFTLTVFDGIVFK